MKVRWDPRRQRSPGLKGKLLLQTSRGQLKIQSWPRKRGTPKSQVTRDQNTWFKQAKDIAKRLAASQQNLAIEMTKGTGLYPADLLLRQQAGGIYQVVFEDGFEPQYRRYFRSTVVFQGVILHLLVSQALVPNVLTLITFPLPVRDTAGFWSAGAPTRITIPAGINVVKLEAGWNGTVAAIGRRQILVIYKNGAIWRVMDGYSFSTPAQTIVMGSDTVVTGDYFEIKILCPIAQSALGSSRTFMTLNVLDAD